MIDMYATVGQFCALFLKTYVLKTTYLLWDLYKVVTSYRNGRYITMNILHSRERENFCSVEINEGK